MRLRRYRKNKDNLFYFQFLADGGYVIAEAEKGYEERDKRDRVFQQILKYGADSKNVTVKVHEEGTYHFQVLDRRGRVLISSKPMKSRKEIDEYTKVFIHGIQQSEGVAGAKTPKRKRKSKFDKPTYQKKGDTILQAIEGIGPKSEAALNVHGIVSFSDLATSGPSSVEQALLNAGLNTGILNFASWIEQAEIAREGDWDRLRSYQINVAGSKHAKVSKFANELSAPDQVKPEVETRAMSSPSQETERQRHKAQQILTEADMNIESDLSSMSHNVESRPLSLVDNSHNHVSHISGDNQFIRPPNQDHNIDQASESKSIQRVGIIGLILVISLLFLLLIF